MKDNWTKMHILSCMKCGKEFKVEKKTENGRCPDCEREGKFVTVEKYQDAIATIARLEAKVKALEKEIIDKIPPVP